MGVELAYVDRETVLINDSKDWLPTGKEAFEKLRDRVDEDLTEELRRTIDGNKTQESTNREEKESVE